MKRFRFQLQTALDWRRRLMETEQMRLEELQSKRNAVLAAKAAADQSVEESRRTTLQSPTVMAGELAALDNYRQAVEYQNQRLDREAAQLAESILQQRRVLIEATLQFRLLDKLRSRRMAEWKKESDRQIETEAGELYLAKWGSDKL